MKEHLNNKHTVPMQTDVTYAVLCSVCGSCTCLGL